ncbi:MAG: hypothetical protein HQL31_06925, partial [Planctomycetes bacterium]|nr:hypothetical protein [Planctomycetota bacterium]
MRTFATPRRVAALLLGILIVAPLHAYLLTQWTPLAGGGVKWAAGSPAAFYSGGSVIYHIITGGTYAISNAAEQAAVDS